MFIRKLKNRLGSISVQIISKERVQYKVVKTIGSSFEEQVFSRFIHQAKQEIFNLQRQTGLPGRYRD